MNSTASPVRSKERFLVFGAPEIREEEIEEVVAVLRSGWIGTGPRVGGFERQFAEYKGVDLATGVSSCTAAMHLALSALGVGPGDEVIVPALTFCATVNVVIHAGATPVLADVDPVSMTLDVRDVARRITERTRAIIPVHFAGRPCQMDELLALAEQNDLVVVEDCAHAIETEYHGRRAGTMGDAGCFSFYATKNVTSAEGGMVVTRDPAVAARIRTEALHGLSVDAWKRYSDDGYQHYYAVSAGFKYNLTDLQAAIGIHQLARVEANWVKRLRIWERYQDELSSLPIELPAPFEHDTRHALHLFTIRIDAARTGVSRDRFVQRMTENGIGVGVHYVSIPEHPYYARTFGWTGADVPVADRIGREIVSIPLAPSLTDEDVADVCEAVRRSLEA
jgi:dTDP-4-amino-4,6-dideoxygalactose transaminase